MGSLRKLNLLIVILVLLATCQLFGIVESVNIKAPTILSFAHEPLEPPPEYSVNVTATISSPRPLSASGVTVSYFTSTNINQTVHMVFVEGNETLALYFGTLPPHSEEGTQVTYKIVAIDSSGFRGESGFSSYVVKRDQTSPYFYPAYPAQPYPNANIPITNRTEVQVRFRISDSGSGVRNAILRYSNSSDPNAPVWRTAEMRLSEGDRYDGNWTAVLRPESNGTTVLYEPEAYDFCENRGFGQKGVYDVQNPPAPRAEIQITVDDLDFASKLMTITIICTITYGSPYDAFLLQIQQGYGSGQSWNVNATYLSVPRVGGFFYQGILKWRTQMVGASNFYPFDWYILDLHMRLLVSGLNSSNTRVTSAFFGPISLVYDYGIMRNQTVPLSGWSDMYFKANVTRKPNLGEPMALMGVVYATFFVLGSIALLTYGKEGFVNRLRILIGIFTFAGILYFTITRVLQDAGISDIVGLVVPQALLLGLVGSVVVFVVGSLIGLLFDQSGRLLTHNLLKVHSLSLGLSVVALVLIVSLSQTNVLGETRNFFEIVGMRNFVVCGLFFAAVGRTLADIWRHRSQIIDMIARRDRKSDFDDCTDEYET